MARQTTAPGTVDENEVARFSRARRRVVEPARAAGARCTRSIRCGSPYITRPRGGAFRPRPEAARQPRRAALLDIGCGGGLLCEPLARLGAAVIGADPRPRTSRWRSLHAEQTRRRRRLSQRPPPRSWRKPAKISTSCSPWKWSSTSPTSACSSPAAANGEAGRDHVRRHDQPHAEGFALAIVGAEYVLRWLPRGTHQYDKLVTPGRARDGARAAPACRHRRDRRDLRPARRPLAALADMDVNYMMAAEKAT